MAQHAQRLTTPPYERGTLMSHRRFCFWIALTLLLAGLQSAYAGVTVPGGPKLDPVDLKGIMLVDDIRPGMKGYGKTVFLGTKITTFNVEVLGVLKKVMNGTDLIVVKLSGGPITERGANLIHGCSGSPIYINGKLVGAFAYGEAFVKEPIGMVTPIQYMLEAWDSSLPTKPSSFSPFSTSLDSPIKLDGRSFGKVAIDSSVMGHNTYDAGTMVFQPLSMPFYVSGASPRVLSALQEILKPLNITPLAGPGTASQISNMNIKLEPGSSVGVSLMTGDMDMTAIGTVTYRRGNKVLAFGHPMMGAGALEAPLTTAYVYGISPNLMASSKIAGPVKTVGTLIQDRPWGIYGEVSKMPDMVPVSVHLSDTGLGRKRDFNVKVTNHPLFSKVLVGMVVSEAMNEMRPVPTEATAKIKFRVEADGVTPIVRENTYFSSIAADVVSVTELNQVLALLQSNQFHPVDVKKVDVWVEMNSGHKTAKIERVFLKQTKFDPGETIEVGALLRPFKGEKFTKILKLKLPKNMPTGTFSLAISGGTSRGMESMLEEASIAGALGGAPGASVSPSFENIDQVINKFLEKDKNNDLVAKIVLPKPVPSVGGKKFVGLPPTMIEAMKSTKSTAAGMDKEEVKFVEPTDYIISGTQRLSITVRKQGSAEKKSDAKKSTEISTPPSVEPPSDPGISADEADESEAITSSGSFGMATADSSSSPIAPVSIEKPESTSEAVSEAASSEETKSDEKPSASSEAKTSGSSDKPVVRAAISWRQAVKNDFANGKLVNTIVTTGDLVRLGSSVQTLVDIPETYVWSMASDGKGNSYAGTGNHGVIYKIGSNGTVSQFYKSPELEINSLACDASGNIYAGTSPDGKIYKIDASGKAVVFYKAPEKYIVGLAFDSKGILYAAAGDACKVYKITPEGKSAVVLDSSENYALSIKTDSKDNVYVGTGQDGLIYKITPSGTTSVLYDAAEDSVTALAVDQNDVLYAGTAPKGVIYKLAPNQAVKTIYDKAGTGITGLCVDKTGVYATNLGNVFQILPDDTVAVLDNKQDRQFLTAWAAGGVVYLGTGNTGSICTASTGKVSDGTFDSTVRDCSLPSTWGTISWSADLPTGAQVSFQTRTGNSAEPDASWSGWSAPITKPGSRIDSPANRYIQYRASFKSTDVSQSPKLKDITITYLPQNQSPKVTITVPKGGEKWSKTQTLKWSGTDPDKDTLTYDLFYSSDNGTTWKSFSGKPDVASEKKDDAKEKSQAALDLSAIKVTATHSKEQIRDAVAAELEKHPEISVEMKKKILDEAPDMVQKDSSVSVEKSESSSDTESEEAKKPRDAKQTNFKWDTSTVPDGVYLVKIVGSDRLSNPVGALTNEAISRSVTICNKQPVLVLLKKASSILPDKTAHVEGIAFQKTVGISCVQYRIDSGDWTAAAPGDGIYDSGFETFSLTTPALTAGDHTIEVKAFDQAGNTASGNIKLTVH